MKIHFLEVTGRVAIDDKFSAQDATTGMNLETSGRPCVILTGDNSLARLVIESKTVDLGANTFLYSGFSRPRQVKGSLKEIRYVLGKLWSMIDGGTLREDDTSDAAVKI